MNTKPFYSPFVQLVVGLLLVAICLRLTWEVLRPVLVPLTFVALVVVLLILGARYLWYRGSL